MMDFRPNELVYRRKSKTEYMMEIIHKETGKKVIGRGDHEYKLECDLLQKLRQKVREDE